MSLISIARIWRKRDLHLGQVCRAKRRSLAGSDAGRVRTVSESHLIRASDPIEAGCLG